MYRLSLISNLTLIMRGKETYNILELENDIEASSDPYYNKNKMSWATSFILTEEQALYFKSKYDHFIKSIEEIEEDNDE